MANRDKIISKFNKKSKTKQRIADGFNGSSKKKKDRRAILQRRKQKQLVENSFDSRDD